MSYLGNSPGVASQRVVSQFTATANQTTFIPTSGYIVGYVDVFLNGTKLVVGEDYTASNGTSVVLVQGVAVGDSVEVVSFIPRGLSDGYLKSEADARYVQLSTSFSGDISGTYSALTLASSGVTAGSYGSASAIPQITVDSKGRITAVSTNAVSIPSGSISVTGGDITMSGNTGTAITNATIANGAVTAAKLADGAITSAKLDTNITIAGALTVSGNLTVSGTTTTVNSTTLEVADLNVVLGSGATSAAAANGAGITIGNYASNPTILYNSTNNTFAINRGVEVAGGINVSGVNVSGSLSMVNTTNGIYGHYYSTVTNGNITFYNAYNNTDPRFIWYGGTGSNLTYHTNNLALYPGTDVGLNLGLSNFRWNNFYVSTVYSGHMYPSTDNSFDLGSFTARWRNIYTADMHFSNEGSQNSVDGTWGNWTLQEGEENIYMLNNRTGRKYKIVLEEV